jgi:hypothetical protein
MTTGAYVFQLAPGSKGGVILDENVISRGAWAWIDRTHEWEATATECAGFRRWLMIYARCPDCGNLSTLWRLGSPPGHTHEVSSDGLVTPSVQCPHAMCTFHTQPTRLDGFKDLRSVVV